MYKNMNLKLKSVLFLISFIIIQQSLFGQSLNIQFEIEGLPNQDIIIAHHFGENTLVDDTIHLNNDGYGVFKRDSLLPKGLYLCIYPDHSYFEFILDDDQEFEVKTTIGKSAEDYIKNMKLKGTDINKVFFDYQLFMIELNQESNDLRQALKEEPNNKDIKDKLQGLNIKVQNKWKEIKEKEAGSFMDKMLRALEDVEVPDPPKDADGKIIDSLFQYNYYKDHFFDNIDFSDNQMLFSPVYHRKLKYYYDKVVARRPDSVITATDRLLQRFESSSKYFQYTLAHVFNKYANSNYMGFDKVMVHLADQYYLNGKADWVSDDYLKKLKERVDKLRPNLIGSKAPNLDKMQSVEGYFYPLHDVKAKYTVVVFWEPNCGHCKKEIPQLHEEVFIGLSEYNVQVYAVYTQVDRKEWTEFIEKKAVTDWVNVWDPNNFTDFRNKYDVYSTPTLYLLDEQKNIIAKRVDVKTIISIIKEKGK
jgi:thiol-disulfide isomerase/thioredoxin